MRLLSGALALGLLAACGGDANPAEPVSVLEPWVRPAPTGDRGSVYLRLRNPGSVDEVLLGASLAGAETVEIHSMSMVSGMMQMHRLDRLEVPAGQEILFAPGQYHLMVVGLARPLVVGSEVRLTLHLARGDLDVMVPVAAPTATHR